MQCNSMPLPRDHGKPPVLPARITFSYNAEAQTAIQDRVDRTDYKRPFQVKSTTRMCRVKVLVLVRQTSANQNEPNPHPNGCLAGG